MPKAIPVLTTKRRRLNQEQRSLDPNPNFSFMVLSSGNAKGWVRTSNTDAVIDKFLDEDMSVEMVTDVGGGGVEGGQEIVGPQCAHATSVILLIWLICPAIVLHLELTRILECLDRHSTGPLPILVRY